MDVIFEEHITLYQLATRLKEKNKPIHFIYESSSEEFDEKIVKGAKAENIKIWFPKSFRKKKNELDLKKIVQMKLKKMVMYNGEEAYFLIE